MPPEIPNLDDRRFDDLLDLAAAHLRARCPDWRGDLHPGEPATLLIDVFAHLTEVLLYRINRLPERAYAELARLVGLERRPPSGALATLEFTRQGPEPLVIAAGTRVSTANREVVFVTLAEVQAQPDTPVQAPAVQAEPVRAELVGYGTGEAGLRLRVARPPILGVIPGFLDHLVVGVEADGAAEAGAPLLAERIRDKAFEAWQRVDSFLDRPETWPRVFCVDRLHGELVFPPLDRLDDAESAAGIPAPGREIRVWYLRGGGRVGPVGPAELVHILDALPGVAVTNPAAAQGGWDAETTAQLLERLPGAIRHRGRAVTASDYEALALEAAPCVVRAFVHAPAQRYAPDRPGTVEVGLVLERAVEESAQVGPWVEQVKHYLDERRILGARCEVRLAPRKQVGVQLQVQAARGADAATVEKDVRFALDRLLSPWERAGWQFGRTLHVSDVYAAMARIPGIDHVVGQVGLLQAPAPTSVDALAADRLRPGTWYWGSADQVFVSTNDGVGWELLVQVPDAAIQAVCPHPEEPGKLAIAAGSLLLVSVDWGRSFDRRDLRRPIRDVAWLPSVEGRMRLLLATDAGIERCVVEPRPNDGTFSWQSLGAYTKPVTAIRSLVALREGSELHIAAVTNNDEVHHMQALPRQDISQLEPVRIPDPPNGLKRRPQCVALEAVNGQVRLWVGFQTDGTIAHGCSWCERPRDANAPWQFVQSGWRGGSCFALAAGAGRVVAATFEGGVLELVNGQWTASDSQNESRFLYRDRRLLFGQQPLRRIAVSATTVMAGASAGLVKSSGTGLRFQSVVPSEAADAVTLPPGWLFAPGEHPLEITHDP